MTKKLSQVSTGFTWKVAAAVALLSAGAYGLVYENAYLASSDAIVSAYVLDVKTPIDGVVTALPNAAGVTVHKGEILGHVENLRVDHQELDSLSTEAARAEITAHAAAVERAVLERQQKLLLNRASVHSVALASRLEIQATEASRVLAARRLTLQQVNLELDRGRKLYDAGIVTAAAYDHLVSDEGIASEGVAAQEAQLASLRKEAASASQGVLLEPGIATEVGYSRQRADEIAMRLSETNRTLITAKEQAREAERLQAIETTRLNLLAQTDLTSPMEGVLWNLGSMSGERVGVGDTILSVVDCGHPFLLASIPQDRVPEIIPFGRAKLRLSGEAAERTGTVVLISGSSEDSRHKFASMPSKNAGEQVATVMIRLDGAEAGRVDSCMVGRTARVLIPTSRSMGVSGLLARLF